MSSLHGIKNVIVINGKDVDMGLKVTPRTEGGHDYVRIEEGIDMVYVNVAALMPLIRALCKVAEERGEVTKDRSALNPRIVYGWWVPEESDEA